MGFLGVGLNGQGYEFLGCGAKSWLCAATQV